MVNFKKAFKENTIGFILISIVGLYILFMFYKYFNSKGNSGFEFLDNNNNVAYKNTTYQQNTKQQMSNQNVRPSEPLGQNETYSSVKGIQTTSQGIPTSCNKANITNPDELLPKDVNNDWAQLNPSGQGMLSNINLLKAGYHIGIDSIGQTLKNANLQIRSEPPNPQTNVSIWNQSTISPDYMRVPLEIGSSCQ
jgi:hypothetical protein